MKKNTDILSGSLFKNILFYSIPIILTGILQLLYNAADIVVVGRYAGSNSLAAVGSTSSLINLFINLFIGLSAGTNVCVAQYIGAKDPHSVRKAVHTSVCVAFWGGIILMVLGLCFSKLCLALMQTPTDIIDEASLYMRILFIGMPFNLIYNFCAAILRASGNTKTPLLILSFAGIVNVILNLVLVITFNRGADGVGTATIISQFISMCLVLRYLIKETSDIKLNIKSLGIDKYMFIRILKIGIPSGIQGMLFSISNVLIQSSINSFGAAAIAGNSAAGNIEGFAYTSMNSFHQSTLTFTGQSLGAKKFRELKRTLVYGCIQVTLVGIFASILLLSFGPSLLELYAPEDKTVISYGINRLHYILPLYFTCGIMEVVVGSLRGMGASLSSMLVSVFGVCGIRIAWVYTVFSHYKTLSSLYCSYPTTWIITALIQLLLCLKLMHSIISAHK